MKTIKISLLAMGTFMAFVALIQLPMILFTGKDLTNNKVKTKDANQKLKVKNNGDTIKVRTRNG